MLQSGKNILLRIQSPEGTKRIEISPKATLKDLFEHVRKLLNVQGFGLFKERNFTKELHANTTQLIGANFKHGDMIYLKQMANTSKRGAIELPVENVTNTKNDFKNNSLVTEDEVDELLAKETGLIKRHRDNKLCRHAANGCCVHCSPLEPYDETYLREHKIKHMSFHSYIRKQTSGIDRGKYMVFENINCRIKVGCREHPPWPKGICSKCQPSAITLNRQIYRHVDNVMFENTTIVERFLNYWRITGHQRMGFLFGTYEMNTDVPLGIRAKVAAIYEPPQESSRDSIKLLDDDHVTDIEHVAKTLGLKKVGWIFTDLITDDPSNGTVKQLRGIETHFLTAQECIMAGELQNRHPNPCKYSSNGNFGSKFVTVCVTGDKTKQVHMEGYAVSAQCMALVRDNCLVPTKDAPELGYIRESSDKQYVPDVYYKEKDQYGNEVQRLARPLPVEYLLVDVPATTPLQPQYTFNQCDKGQPFPVENRYLDGHLQDFNALSTYLSQWNAEDESEFLEAISDFHLLIYLYKMDMLPMRQHVETLLVAVRDKNSNMAKNFKKKEIWKLLESLIQANSNNKGVSVKPQLEKSAHTTATTSTGLVGDLLHSPKEHNTSDTWTCHHCTFINRNEFTSCEMCSLPR